MLKSEVKNKMPNVTGRAASVCVCACVRVAGGGGMSAFHPHPPPHIQTERHTHTTQPTEFLQQFCFLNHRDV